MEMIMVPKILAYVCNIMVICYIIHGIYWIIEKIKNNRKKKFDEAMDRMSKHYVDISVKHPTFPNAVYDIPYEDAVKVFMLYEKFKQKKLKNERKCLEKQAEKMANGE